VPVRGVVLNLAKGSSSHPYVYSYSERARRRSSVAAVLPQGWRPVIRAAVAIVATAAVAVATVLLSTHPAPAQAGTIPAAAPAATATATSSKKVAAFIGDAVVQGNSSGSLAAGVAGALGWQAVNLGRGGTGYVTSAGTAKCGLDYCAPFPMMAADAIAAKPDVVVVSGGPGDGTTDVSTAAGMLFTQLHKALPKAKVIVVAPMAGSGAVPASLTALRSQVKAAARTAGVSYIDIGSPLAGHPELVASDGVHLTKDGYAAVAKLVAQAIGKL
jgi:lysophospholipase L1-like esterase